MDLGASIRKLSLGALAVSSFLTGGTAIAQAQAANSQRPNIVMLMTDDTGWNDFGAYSGGGAALGHPTPNIDKMAKWARFSPVGTVRRVVQRAAHPL